MWTVWDTVGGRRTRSKKEGGASAFTPSSLKVLALMDLAPSPSRARHQPEQAQPIRHSPERGTRHQGRLESTRSPSDEYSKAWGNTLSTDGPSVFGKDTGQGVTAVREWNPFWLGVSALTTLKGYKTLRKFKEKFRFNFWTFTTKNTRLHPSNPPIEPKPPVWLIPGGVW